MIGIDLVEIKRFKDKTKSFLSKYFLKNELEYAKTRKNETETLAGIFACKEAFLKAVGIGIFKGIALADIEIAHNDKGAPIIIVSKQVKKQFQIKKCEVSISHEKDYSIAICKIN